MRYTALGKLRVSVVGIGAWQAGMRAWGSSDRESIIEAYRYAFEQGINLVDTAEIYGWGRSERVVGEAVRGYDVVVATKIAGCFFSPRWIEKRLRGSLERLGLESIGLYQVHWPPSIYTRLCPGMRKLEELADKGLIREIGVSNFDARLFEKAAACLVEKKIASNQVEYSLVQRAPEKKLFPVMKSYGARIIAWGPLAKGALAGKKRVDNLARLTDPRFHRARRDRVLLDALASVAEEQGVPMAAVAVAWVVAKGAVPIVGVRKKQHVDTLVEAAELSLKPDQMRLLDEVSTRYIRGDITRVASRIIPNILLCGTLWLTRGA